MLTFYHAEIQSCLLILAWSGALPNDKLGGKITCCVLKFGSSNWLIKNSVPIRPISMAGSEIVVIFGVYLSADRLEMTPIIEKSFGTLSPFSLQSLARTIIDQLIADNHGAHLGLFFQQLFHSFIPSLDR